MKPTFRKIGIGAGIGLTAILLLLLAAWGWIQTPQGKSSLASLIESALSDAEHRVTIGKLDGSLPIEWRLSDIQLSDNAGTIASVDRLHVRWTPAMLLSKVVSVSDISMGRVNLYKTGSSNPPDSASQPGAATPLSKIPATWSLLLENFSIEHIHIAPEILGHPVDASFKSKIEFQDIERGLSLEFDLQRIDDTDGIVKAQILFKPAQETIHLAMSAHEPESGILVRLLNIPGLPKFDATIIGQGGLSDWQGDLKVSAGKDLTVEGGLGLNAKDMKRPELTLNLDSNVALMLAPELQPLLAKSNTRLRLALESPQSLQIESLDISAAAGKLKLAGAVKLDDQHLKLSYAIEPQASSVYSDFTQGLAWSSMSIKGTARGTTDRPELIAQITAQKTTYENYALDTLSSEIKLAPASATGKTLWAIASKASLKGMKTSDPKLDALAEQIEMKLQGELDPEKGNLSIQTAKLDIPSGAMELSGTVTDWGRRLQLAQKISAPDLKAFASLLPTPVEGSLVASLNSDIRDHGQNVSSQITGTIENIKTDQLALDRMAGKRLAFSANIAKDASGAIHSDRWKITGASVEAQGHGTLNADQTLTAETHFHLARLDELPLDRPVQGSASISILAKGSIANPELNIELSSEQLSIEETSVQNLRLTTTVRHPFAEPAGSFQGTVSWQDRPLQWSSHYAVKPGELIRLEQLKFSGLQSTIEGDLEYSIAEGIAKGSLRGVLSDSLAFEQWTGQAVSGRWEFKVDLADQEGQSVSLTANGSGIKNQEPENWSIESASLSAKLKDVLRSPSIDAQMQANNIVLQNNKMQVSESKAEIKGDLNLIDWSGTAKGASNVNFEIASAGSFDQKDAQMNLLVSKMNGSYGAIPFKLTQPLTASKNSQLISMQGMKLQVASGELLGDLSLQAEKNKAQFLIRQFPLDLAGMILPDLKVSGKLDGEVILTGTLKEPIGRIHLLATDTGFEIESGLNLDQGVYEVKADWQKQKLRLESKLSQPVLGTVNLTGLAPLVWNPADKTAHIPQDQPLKGNAEGRMDLKVWNDYFSAEGESVAGKLDFKTDLAGTWLQPQFSGKVSLDDGKYENMLYGTALHAITMRIVGDAESMRMESFSATTPGDGNLSGNGVIHLTSLERFDAELNLKIDKAQFVGLDSLTAKTSGTINVKGNQELMTVKGEIIIDQADIRIPDRLPAQVVILEYVEVGSESTTPQNSEDKQIKLFNPVFDLKVTANNQVYVRGSGLNAELNADCLITGTLAEPNVSGKLSLKQGTLDFLGKRMTFSRGVIGLDGAPKKPPTLDFKADIAGKNVTLHALVTGTVSQPQIKIDSTPEIPKDEALSQLLFGKSSSTLSPLEAVQLVDATAQLAGMNTGSSQLMDDVRNSLGLDKLSVNSNNPSGATQIEGGRYISEKVYVGVKETMGTETSSATVQVEVTPNINVESDIGGENSRVGVNMEWDY
ncbi:MAG: hypothetical protein G3M78_09840 [Candidatus Nitrohelix vancouverensis]|uniref:Translocation and assembly module TamB C-terminal domain-containing protein n=1 Tax=Candidatus Nitrohelix vancouverensis TaxID=2705534 RepID=A0A7T0C342_9BACT|nr:MAG: hypothetical protein G3M78_09840 [Candidatus Nitrohelix vancouverensis]